MSTGFFRDAHGRVVLFQPPNAPIIGWLVLVVINYFVQSVEIGWVATVLLFTWAVLELARGVTYFRRALGLVVLVGIVLAHLFVWG